MPRLTSHSKRMWWGVMGIQRKLLTKLNRSIVIKSGTDAGFNSTSTAKKPFIQLSGLLSTSLPGKERMCMRVAIAHAHENSMSLSQDPDLVIYVAFCLVYQTMLPLLQTLWYRLLPPAFSKQGGCQKQSANDEEHYPECFMDWKG